MASNKKAQKKPTFSKLLKSDLPAAITFAQANKLKFSDINKGLFFAFEHNHPELWKAIADNHIIKSAHLLDMMEENDGEMLHVDMVRLWLDCKPSQDLMDDCLFFVGNGLDLTSIPCINTQETAHELLAMLVEAGASSMDILPYLLEHGLSELAEKLYSSESQQQWLQSAIGMDERTDAWLLAKPINFKGKEGSALLYALICCANKELFNQYVKQIDVTVSFSDHESLMEAAFIQDDDVYINGLLKHGAQIDNNGDFHGILCQAIYAANTKRVKLLLDSGIDPNKSIHDSSILTAAVNCGDINMAKLLLDYGVNPHTPRNEAMFEAREQENAEMEQLLLDAGAPPLGAPDPYSPRFDMPKDLKGDSSDMVLLWQAWLDFYKQYANLTPNQPIQGASQERINQLEKHIGFELPEDLKTIYRLSEGGDYLFFGASLLTPEEVCERWTDAPHDQKDMLEGGYYDDNRPYGKHNTKVKPEGSIEIKPVDAQGNFKHKARLHVIGGNIEFDGCLFVDFAPGKTGTIGQIINIEWGSSGDWQGEEEPTWCYRLASNLTELVNYLEQKMAEGQFELSPSWGGICFDMEADYDPETGEGNLPRTTLRWLRETKPI